MNWPTILISFFKDRPAKFGSIEAQLKWESNRQLQFENLRNRIESGEFVPEEIRAKNELKQNLEDGNSTKDKQIKIRQEKVSINANPVISVSLPVIQL